MTQGSTMGIVASQVTANPGEALPNAPELVVNGTMVSSGQTLPAAWVCDGLHPGSHWRSVTVAPSVQVRVSDATGYDAGPAAVGLNDGGTCVVMQHNLS